MRISIRRCAAEIPLGTKYGLSQCYIVLDETVVIEAIVHKHLLSVLIVLTVIFLFCHILFFFKFRLRSQLY